MNQRRLSPLKRPLAVIEHEADCPPGMLAPLAAEAGVDLHVFRPYVGDALPSPAALESDHSGLVVLGGGMGPRDDREHPWLPVTRSLMLSAIDHRLPLFGICLGEELLAAAIGGEIERRPLPELGICTVIAESTPASGDPVFGGEANSAEIFHWHEDQVEALPRAWNGFPVTVLARNAESDIQGFRVGDAAWAVQHHPEITPPIARQWALTSSLIPADRTAESYAAEVAQWAGEQPGGTYGARILSAFLSVVRKRETTTGSSGSR